MLNYETINEIFSGCSDVRKLFAHNCTLHKGFTLLDEVRNIAVRESLKEIRSTRSWPSWLYLR